MPVQPPPSAAATPTAALTSGVCPAGATIGSALGITLPNAAVVAGGTHTLPSGATGLACDNHGAADNVIIEQGWTDVRDQFHDALVVLARPQTLQERTSLVSHSRHGLVSAWKVHAELRDRRSSPSPRRRHRRRWLRSKPWSTNSSSRIHDSKEARPLARVTRGSRGMHSKQHGIRIAIEPDLADLHRVPAGLALFPQALPGAAEEGGAAGATRRLPGLAVHVRNHEHLAGPGVLHNGGDESIVPEARRRLVAHTRTSTPRSRRYAFASATGHESK